MQSTEVCLGVSRENSQTGVVFKQKKNPENRKRKTEQKKTEIILLSKKQQ
jgi:hypothetical protein